MEKTISKSQGKFGTLPVFLTAISTILGAILFLRFGYAVGHVGFWGVIGIILVGHLVTIPTALAVAEISTNQRVMGGGAYYIISRSFGFNIGGAIGITLYLSQAISVAFYIIAFGEAFHPIIDYVFQNYGFIIPKRAITIPVAVILSFLVLTKGANMGMKALYGIVSLLFLSLILFFLGKSDTVYVQSALTQKIADPDNYFFVFAIIFPAFTGLAAGLGLSGDLKRPEVSIPRGTLWATVAGFLIYIAVAYKLATSATAGELAGNMLVMQDIALWGPIIPIGLAAASLSSALGSIMIAPRTLQAIGMDSIFPSGKANSWLAKGRTKDNEPINGSIITIAITFIFIVMGDVDFVAQIISMFFMVTYGAICLISFLEHFAANPSYRPTFKNNRWWLSLIGAFMSFWLMFKMNTPYAILSISIMAAFYYYVSINRKEKQGLQQLFRGVMFQAGRRLQIMAQRADIRYQDKDWRPFLVCISENTFRRKSAFDFVQWVSRKYGFGTYIHFIKGFLTSETHEQSQSILKKLLGLYTEKKSRVYIDTLISPSYTSAIAQVIQLKTISAKRNNIILFEYSEDDTKGLETVLDNFKLIQAAELDVCMLNTSQTGFGNRQSIDVWLTRNDLENGNLMILISYILRGHKDWSKALIRIFAIIPEQELEEYRQELLQMIKDGRLPISPKNIQFLPHEGYASLIDVFRSKSKGTDLSVIGFNASDIDSGGEYFTGFNHEGNILFVKSWRKKHIQ